MQAKESKLLDPVAAIHAGLISAADAVKSEFVKPGYITAREVVDYGFVLAKDLIPDRISLTQVSAKACVSISGSICAYVHARPHGF